MEIQPAANLPRSFLFERVYNPLNRGPDTRRARHVVRALFRQYRKDFEQLPAEFPPARGTSRTNA